jgi:hypothetical protein
MDEELAKFEEILSSASTHVSEQYFQLPVADADTIYRERVYCYELYHQMRRMWGTFPFSLVENLIRPVTRASRMALTLA